MKPITLTSPVTSAAEREIKRIAEAAGIVVFINPDHAKSVASTDMTIVVGDVPAPVGVAARRRVRRLIACPDERAFFLIPWHSYRLVHGALFLLWSAPLSPEGRDELRKRWA